MIITKTTLVLAALLLRPALGNDVPYANATSTTIPPLSPPGPGLVSNLSTTFGASSASASATITGIGTDTTATIGPATTPRTTVLQTLTASNGQLTTLTTVVAGGAGGAGATGTSTPGVQTAGANSGRLLVGGACVAVGFVAGWIAVLG